MGALGDAIRVMSAKDVRDAIADFADLTGQLIINAGSSNAEIVAARDGFASLLDKLAADRTYVDTKFGSLGGTFIFKGSDTTANIQAKTGVNIGDYWHSTDGNTNLAWNGISWADIGNNLKLSNGTVNSDIILNGAVDLSKLNDEVIKFVGKQVVSTVANSPESGSIPLWFVFDITGKTLNGASLRTTFDIFTSSSNISAISARYWASPSSTSLDGGTQMAGDNRAISTGIINKYDNTKTSTMSNNSYLHVLVWANVSNINTATTFLQKNLHVYLNSIELTNPTFKGIWLFGGTISVSDITTTLDFQLSSYKYVNDTVSSAINNYDTVHNSDFIGKSVSVSKANTAETSMAYQYAFDVTGINLVGVPLRATFDFLTSSSNVTSFEIVFWNNDTLSIAGTAGRPGTTTPILNTIQTYDKSMTSPYTTSKKYLYVVIWVKQLDANIATEWNFKNLHAYVNGVEILNPVLSSIYIAGGTATAVDATVPLPSTYATKSYVTNYVAGKVNNFQPYQSGQIYFNVPVNQNFDNNTNTADSLQDSESFNNVPCVLMLPTNYDPDGKPVPLVMRAHGAGGTVTSSSGGEIAYGQTLVDAGYAIFDVNGSSDTENQHMGSPRAIQAYKKALQYIQQNYNVEKRIFVHGGSMGCLAAMNFTIANPGLVKAVGIFSGVTDLYNQAWLVPWLGSTKAALARNYNFADQSGNTWEADKVIGYNPISNNAVDINSQHYVFFPIPLKFWHGDADTVVSPANSQALIDSIRRAGGKAYLRMVAGQSHSMALSTDSAVNQEEVMWFNRFKD